LRYRTTDTSRQNGRLFGNGGAVGAQGVLHNAGSGAVNSESYAFGTARVVGSQPESEADPLALAADGNWHWAGTGMDRATNTFSYYVDHHLVASKPIGQIGSVSFANLLIGANSSDTNYAARLTSVDEFRLYDRALTAGEVRDLITPSIAVPEPGTVVG